MNKAILTICIILIIDNLLVGIILSSFGWMNVVASTLAIVITALILLGISNGSIELKQGFKVSLSFIIPVFGTIEYLLAIVMPNKATDNWCLICIIIILAIEAGLLSITSNVSKK